MSRAKRKERNRERSQSGNITYINPVPNKRRQVEVLPRNLSQETYLETLKDYKKHIVFAIGPAGTGKTLIGV